MASIIKLFFAAEFASSFNSLHSTCITEIAKNEESRLARIGLENIIMSFGTNGKRSTVLEDINLQVNDGDFVSLIGPSGCGKSTLLDLVAGLKKPTNGQIFIDGREILGPGPDRGVVFQDYSLFPWMSALENIYFAN